MLVNINTLEPWLGEAINGLRHPLNIEQLWTQAELEKAGLFAPVPFVVPEGQAVVGDETYELVDGVVYASRPTEPYVAPVPGVVSARQLRLALFVQSLTASVEAAVAASTDDVKISWEYTTEFHRQHPMVLAIAAAINKTEAEIDDLFVLAATF